MLREVADREVVKQGGGGQGGGGVSHIWCWDNIKCFLLACLVLFSCFKVVFIVPVSVHGPEFKRSECMYLIS